MNIRCFEPTDVDEAKRIHELYFRHNFGMPDLTDFLCAYVVEDEKGIITVGGIRDVPEVTIMTDQKRDPMDRFRALGMGLQACMFFAARMDYKQLRCYVNDPKYSKRLQKSFGFYPSGRDELILDI